MISRRSVLKAIAATVMAPTIQLRTAVPDERLLLEFCDPESWRYSFEKPFGIGSLTYATDSRAMIRCELKSRIEEGERRLPHNTTQVWNRWWKPQMKWKALTLDDLRSTEGVNGNCPDCGNRRVWYGENYPTDQEDADALPDWDVDDNTIRDVSCTTCRGREYDGPSCVRVCGVLHSSWNMRRILALPNPYVCQASHFVSAINPGKRHGAILFRAEGFEGISMGIEENQ